MNEDLVHDAPRKVAISEARGHLVLGMQLSMYTWMPRSSSLCEKS
jgi:hypothetical protein